MKKYGVYVASKNPDAAVLIRECDTLKAAVKEAYRLSRYFYSLRANKIVNFIVGNNTGVIKTENFEEVIRYSAICYTTISEHNLVWIVRYGGYNRVKRSYIIRRKSYEKIYDISKE